MGIFTFTLPDIGEGIHEGEIVKWHIKEGDTVAEDQTILEVQNDKAVVEIPSPVNGVVKEIKVPEGTVSVVGDPLVSFEVEGEGNAGAAEGNSPKADEKASEPDQPRDREEQPKQEQAPPEAIDKTLILATPSVRKLAREKGVNLSAIKGTGPRGRITREDVLGFTEEAPSPSEKQSAALGAEDTADPKAAEAGRAEPTLLPAAAAANQEDRVPLKGVRKVIAEAMVRSKTTAPHVTIMDEADVTKLVSFRQRIKPMAEKKQVKVTYLPFIVKAVIGALRTYPSLNASIDDERAEIVYKKFYNIGIATDTDNGLMVPVIASADQKNIWTIAKEIQQLAEKARDGKLAPQEMKNGTFTITNIGSAGGQFFTPIINWPEAAILGVGRITEKPVIKDGSIQRASIMALSLSFDHRLIDGVTAQLFMNDLKAVLEDPDMLVMEV